jgi:homoserine dehydrogenase
MERQQLNIGLFGFGCVGEGLYQVLERTPTLKASIRKICIKHPDKKRSITSEIFTTEAPSLLNDPNINVIVELIDDSEAAFVIVKAALLAGKPVVSANKKMLAEHFEELMFLQEQTGCQVLYEAACCASIPLIRNLEEYYDNDLLGGIEGIVNGSTNYILDQMDVRGISFAEALREAQAAGYAESNPALDIEGIDARNKLLILIVHGFGHVLQTSQIFYAGIHKIEAADQAFAKEKGYKIKLLARAAKLANGNLYALVCPSFVPLNSRLAQVGEAYNAVNLQSSFSESQFFLGKGAGAFPTASAVLSDLSALSYGYRYEYRKAGQAVVLANEAELILRIYWRTNGDTQRSALYFQNVEQVFIGQTQGFIIGEISLKNLKLLQSNFRESSFVLVDVLEENKTVFIQDLSLVETLTST